MTKMKIAAAVGVVAAAVLMVSRFFGGEDAVEYERRPTVIVGKPERGDIELYTEMTGLIEPRSQAAVMPKISGEVLEVYFQVGDTVEAGQVLCRLDSDVLTTLELQMNAQAVALDDMTSTANRTRALHAGGFVSDEVMEQTENGLKSTQIAYNAAKTQYELQLEYSMIESPISGVIESRNIELHDYVSPAAPICIISGKDELQVKFGITEKVYRELAVGDTIEVEKNGVSYQGQVTEIGDMVNAATGLHDVWAMVSDSDGLTNGTRVKLTVRMNSTRDAMLIPLDAVSYDDGIPFIYCYEDGIARKTEIETGIYDTVNMEVRSGLTEEQLVITSWSNELVDGAEVLLKEETDRNGSAEGDAENAEIVSEDGQVTE